MSGREIAHCFAAMDYCYGQQPLTLSCAGNTYRRKCHSPVSHCTHNESNVYLI